MPCFSKVLHGFIHFGNLFLCNMIYVKEMCIRDRSIPPALEESAKIDGATNLQVLFKIYLPISTPVLATVSLWYSVRHWNAWMDNMLYVTKSGLYVLQYVIQTILTNGKTADMEMVTDVIVHTETMKMAALILSLIPIVCTYPFLQKYFVKGMMVGSVKG